MRKINKDFNNAPNQRCAKDKYQNSNLLTAPQNHNFDGRCYKTATQAKLYEIYNHKCAACESKIVWLDLDESGVPKIDEQGNLVFKEFGATIEHYRPKKGGYYWLGYEWSNLIPCCEGCNNPKGDKFETKNPKIRRHPTNIDGSPDLSRFRADSELMLGEKPKIINPEIDHPIHYLAINRNGLLVTAKQLELESDENVKTLEKERVEYTIDVYKLNRNPLIKNRLGIIDTILKRIQDALFASWFFLFNYSNDAKVFNEILATILDPIFEDLYQLQNPDKEYTLVGFCLWYDFDKIITETVVNTLYEKQPTLDKIALTELLLYAFKTFKKQKEN